MATHTWHGWAKPDDPIYKTGPVIGGKRFINSSKAEFVRMYNQAKLQAERMRLAKMKEEK